MKFGYIYHIKKLCFGKWMKEGRKEKIKVMYTTYGCAPLRFYMGVWKEIA